MLTFGNGRRLHGRRGLKSLIIEAKSFVDGSPPSRAAWIEILQLIEDKGYKKSPPSRAAWIEIAASTCWRALSARRRLHGRRGLKCIVTDALAEGSSVAAFTGGVD